MQEAEQKTAMYAPSMNVMMGVGAIEIVNDGHGRAWLHLLRRGHFFHRHRFGSGLSNFME